MSQKGGEGRRYYIRSPKIKRKPDFRVGYKTVLRDRAVGLSLAKTGPVSSGKFAGSRDGGKEASTQWSLRFQ